MVSAPPAFQLTAATFFEQSSPISATASGIAGLEGLCAPVANALTSRMERIGVEAFFGTYRTLLTQIAQRRWVQASTIAARSDLCQGDLAACRSLVSVLRQGCPSSDVWVELPSWERKRGNDSTLLDLRVLHTSWKGKSSLRSTPLWIPLDAQTPSGWHEAEIQLNVSLTASGVIDCRSSLGTERPTVKRIQVRVTMSQARVGLAVFTRTTQVRDAGTWWLPSDATLSSDAASPAFTLTEERTRWWDDYDALRLIADPSALLGAYQSPSAVCERFRAESHPNATTISMDLEATLLALQPLNAGMYPTVTKGSSLLPSLYRVRAWDSNARS
jgi:hypothetical protein